MNLLILNQAFYPDIVSTAQHATDMAVALVERGHKVTVLCSSRGYDDPSVRFPKHELWRGIEIVRVRPTGFGKSAKWRRAADFASFIASSVVGLSRLSRFDVIVAMTSPPLISFVAALAVPLKARQLVFWSMDLNPDEAIAAGWLSNRSVSAKMLAGMLQYSLDRADRVVALDRFMRQRIEKKGIPGEKISVVPPWSHDDHVRFDRAGRERFRQIHQLRDKFVVMYSGNHSPCHPLDTLLHAAAGLSSRNEILFCFMGGGSEFRKVQEFARDRGLKNIITLPYQPLNSLAASLSAADLHVVVMGDAYVGIVHPCKIYNILTVNSPVLYIGPEESHISDILGTVAIRSFSCATGDVGTVKESVLQAFSEARGSADRELKPAESFAKARLLPKMMAAVEGYGEPFAGPSTPSWRLDSALSNEDRAAAAGKGLS